jgi:hypothetical protein
MAAQWQQQLQERNLGQRGSANGSANGGVGGGNGGGKGGGNGIGGYAGVVPGGDGSHGRGDGRRDVIRGRGGPGQVEGGGGAKLKQSNHWTSGSIIGKYGIGGNQ